MGKIFLFIAERFKPSAVDILETAVRGHALNQVVCVFQKIEHEVSALTNGLFRLLPLGNVFNDKKKSRPVSLGVSDTPHRDHLKPPVALEIINIDDRLALMNTPSQHLRRPLRQIGSRQHLEKRLSPKLFLGISHHLSERQIR